MGPRGVTGLFAEPEADGTAWPAPGPAGRSTGGGYDPAADGCGWHVLPPPVSLRRRGTTGGVPVASGLQASFFAEPFFHEPARDRHLAGQPKRLVLGAGAQFRAREPAGPLKFIGVDV